MTALYATSLSLSASFKESYMANQENKVFRRIFLQWTKNNENTTQCCENLPDFVTIDQSQIH